MNNSHHKRPGTSPKNRTGAPPVGVTSRLTRLGEADDIWVVIHQCGPRLLNSTMRDSPFIKSTGNVTLIKIIRDMRQKVGKENDMQYCHFLNSICNMDIHKQQRQVILLFLKIDRCHMDLIQGPIMAVHLAAISSSLMVLSVRVMRFLGCYK